MDVNQDAVKTAMRMAMTALYGKPEAARDIAKSITTARDPAAQMADLSYQMTQAFDEKMGGQIPPGNLVELASGILGEVGDIAKAAGVKVNGQTIAEAMKNMMVRYVTEQGGNPQQLQGVMGQIDTSKLGEMLDKAGV